MAARARLSRCLPDLRVKPYHQGLADDLVANFCSTGADHADMLCGSLGKIENTTLDERSTVVDANDHSLAIAVVGNLDLGAEPKRAMGRRQVGWVHTFTGSSLRG